MLTPEQIEALREAASRITVPMEEFLIKDIARRISGAGQLTSTAAYQVYRAQQLGLSRRAIERMLVRELKLGHQEIKRLLKQAAEVGYDFDLRHLSRAAVPFDENASLQQMVDAAVKLAKKDFTNLTQTLGMVAPDGKAYPVQKAYQKAMDYAFEQVFTSAADYNTAVRGATKNLADMGLRVIDYESGVHTSIEAAARRNIMGGLGLMQEQISRHNHDAMGADGWEISAHVGSAPDHEPYQGKQYSDADYTALNGRLARRIGTLNCGHAAFPIILGVNSPQYSEEELRKFREDNQRGVGFEGRHYTLYEATQKQRQVERAIRKQKNRILVDEATGDREKLLADQIRLGRLREEYQKFSRGTGLRTQEERLYVAGFGRGPAARAAKSYQTEVDKYAQVRYNEDGTIVVTDDWKPKGKVSIPRQYKPHAVVETQTTFKNGRIQIDRTLYDADGWLSVQIHSGDHNKPHTHSFGADGTEPFHKHTFHRTDVGVERDKEPLDLSEQEKTAHKDILWEVRK